MHLRRLVLHDFKSYYGTHTLEFDAFTCIIGANGSGKSNILDSFLFCFGFNLSKLRFYDFSRACYVECTFKADEAIMRKIEEKYDNLCKTVKVKVTDKSLNLTRKISESGLESMKVKQYQEKTDEDLVEIRIRRDFKNGKSTYTFNGHAISKTAYLDILCLIGIDTTKFLVQQGEIESLSMKKPLVMLEYIEKTIGSDYLLPLIEQAQNDVNVFHEDKNTKQATFDFYRKEYEFVLSRIDDIIQKSLNNCEICVLNLEAAYKYTLALRNNILIYSFGLQRDQNALDGIVDSHSGLNSEMKELNAAILNAKTKLKILERETHSVRTKISSKERELSVFQSKIAKMEAEIKKASELLEKRTQSNQYCEVEVQSIEKELEQNNREISDYEKEVIGLQAELEDLRKTLADQDCQISVSKALTTTFFTDFRKILSESTGLDQTLRDMIAEKRAKHSNSQDDGKIEDSHKFDSLISDYLGVCFENIRLKLISETNQCQLDFFNLLDESMKGLVHGCSLKMKNLDTLKSEADFTCDNLKKLRLANKELSRDRKKVLTNINNLILPQEISDRPLNVDAFEAHPKNRNFLKDFLKPSVKEILTNTARCTQSMQEFHKVVSKHIGILRSVESDINQTSLNDKIHKILCNVPGYYGRIGSLCSIPGFLEKAAVSCAKNSLNNFLVKDAQTAELCIEKIKHIARAGFICLDKIQKTISDEKVRWLQNIKNSCKEQDHEFNINTANLRISGEFLIKYVNFDEKFSKVMYFVFNETMVCDNINTAKKIAFAKIRKRVVTLHGECIEKSGLMCGKSSFANGKLINIVGNREKGESNNHKEFSNAIDQFLAELTGLIRNSNPSLQNACKMLESFYNQPENTLTDHHIVKNILIDLDMKKIKYLAQKYDFEALNDIEALINIQKQHLHDFESKIKGSLAAAENVMMKADIISKDINENEEKIRLTVNKMFILFLEICKRCEKSMNLDLASLITMPLLQKAFALIATSLSFIKDGEICEKDVIKEAQKILETCMNNENHVKHIFSSKQDIYSNDFVGFHIFHTFFDKFNMQLESVKSAITKKIELTEPIEVKQCKAQMEIVKEKSNMVKQRNLILNSKLLDLNIEDTSQLQKNLERLRKQYESLSSLSDISIHSKIKNELSTASILKKNIQDMQKQLQEYQAAYDDQKEIFTQLSLKLVTIKNKRDKESQKEYELKAQIEERSDKIAKIKKQILRTQEFIEESEQKLISIHDLFASIKKDLLDENDYECFSQSQPTSGNSQQDSRKTNSKINKRKKHGTIDESTKNDFREYYEKVDGFIKLSHDHKANFISQSDAFENIESGQNQYRENEDRTVNTYIPSYKSLDTIDHEVLHDYQLKHSEYKNQRQIFMDFQQVLEENESKLKNLKKQRDDLFNVGLKEINISLKKIYEIITKGGQAEIEPVEYDPYAGLILSVRPPKKSWKKLEILSGGEKTMASVALVLAIHQYRPSPFYLLDEIDAALDYKNTCTIAEFLKSSAITSAKNGKRSQFIIVSLRKGFVEQSDTLVGVYKTDTSRTVTFKMNEILEKIEKMAIR